MNDAELLDEARTELENLAGEGIDARHWPHDCDAPAGVCGWTVDAGTLVCCFAGTCEACGYPWPCPGHEAIHAAERASG